MEDAVYHGIKIDTSSDEGMKLHAVNKLFVMANQAMRLLGAVKPKEMKKILKENKMQETMLTDLTNTIESAYASIHYNMLKGSVNKYPPVVKEYISGLDTVSKETYKSAILGLPFNASAKIRIDAAYKKLERAAKDFHTKIVPSGIFGKSPHKSIVKYHGDILEQTIAAKKYIDNMMNQITENKNDGSSDRK